MKFLETRHQRKALAESIVVMLILIALMFVSGLKYLDPPPPGNIAINFGTSVHGSGKVQPVKPVKATPQAQPEPRPSPKEKILTSDQSDAPVVKQQSHKTKKNKSTKTQKPKKSTPKPSKEASSALDDLFNGQSQGSEGNEDNTAGDMGELNGDINSDSRTGNGSGGGGSDPNYSLGSRKATKKPKPNYNCNENGTVVVIVKVNRSGKVIEAKVGRGTTASSCLTQAAIEAAKRTEWEPDSTAEPVQVGTIIYEFKLQ